MLLNNVLPRALALGDMKRYLFFLRIFERVNRYSEDDNATFNDVLPVWVYADVG